MNEFDIIARYFAPLSRDGLRNDGAVLDVPPGRQLVVTSDTLNAGIHFPAGAAAEEIAHKALRVNLSDLAAMGAKPLSYQLNLALPERPEEDWLAAFTGALRADQQEFGIFCSGGDTTRIDGPLSLSITALGTVETGRAWSRSGARAGDHLLLTGPVGDAWVGLQILQDRLHSPHDSYFLERYYRPQPRFIEIPAGAEVHAAIDISDGLAADLGHICEASDAGAEIRISEALFSPPARALLRAGAVTARDLLGGGDDYELLLAVPADQSAEMIASGRAPLPVGEIVSGPPGPRFIREDGSALTLPEKGWTHF